MTDKEQALWDLLDDIDTAFDRFRPKMEPFEDYVYGKAAERHKYLISDGYTLKDP